MNRLSLTLLLALSVSTYAGENAAEARKVKLAYAQKLDDLLTKAKAAGDAADVKEIEAMIAEVEGKKVETSGILAPLVGTWRRDTDGALWRFAADGSGTFNNKGKLALSYDPEGKRFLAVSDKNVDYLTLTRSPDVLNGEVEVGGRKVRFKLERLK